MSPSPAARPAPAAAPSETPEVPAVTDSDPAEPDLSADVPSEIIRVTARRGAPVAPQPAPREIDPADTPDFEGEPPDANAVTFPTSFRGYDQGAVDAYVRQVARTIDQLEAMRTPQEAVRRALDRVGEQTSAILREAEETAERMTAKSRTEADDRVQRAEREADAITSQARSRLRELDVDIDRIWLERQRLIEDTRKLADTLLEIADDAEERFPAEDEAGARPGPGGPAGTPRFPSRDTPAAPPPAGDDEPHASPSSGAGVSVSRSAAYDPRPRRPAVGQDARVDDGETESSD
jgi:DivIVA domain-containing protein